MTVRIEDIDIEQLVAFEGFDYKLTNGSSGPQLNVKTCPSCHSDDWKVYFNAETGLGNCFRCSVTYNPFKFIKFARGFVDNAQVFKYVSTFSDLTRYRPVVTRKYSKANKDWKFPLNTKITVEDDIPEYLKKRSINLKIAERFDLRICDSGFYVYKDYHDRTKAVDFSKRIIIPIKDIHGELVTFQGRDITGVSDKKYLFPNMLPASGAYIYNADYAIKNKIKKIILNEGVFDVFATTQALESDVTFNEYCACASFGKHLAIGNITAQDQLHDLFYMRRNGLEQIVMLWDGEPKAIIAAMETALRLEQFGFNVTVGKLPNNCDPAEVSTAEVLKAIKNAEKVTKLSLVKYRMTNA